MCVYVCAYVFVGVTIDPVVLGDLSAYVVLVGRWTQGASEGGVFAQEV